MRFTIATPSFNTLEWLPCCIASIADQAKTEKSNHGIEIEHIIQDGGSNHWDQIYHKYKPETVNTESYCLKLYSEKDNGMYDAINKAWKEGDGDIFSYLNSDEQYLPGTLSKVQREFEESPDVDVIFGDAVIVNETGKVLSYRRMVIPNQLHTRSVHLGVMSCSMFFRKHVLEQVGMLDASWRAIGDAEWIYRLLGCKVGIKIIPEALAAFGLTGNNLGVNELALLEAQKWRSGLFPLEKKLIPLLKIHHWLKKLLAGAYIPKQVHTKLYVPGSSNHRISCERFDTPYHWID